MFVISVCSMIMITLRVAWHEFVPAEGKSMEEGISKHEEDHQKGFMDDAIEEGWDIVEKEDAMRAAPLETQSIERDAQASSGACLSVSSLMRGNVMSNDVIDVEEEENSSQVGTSDDGDSMNDNPAIIPAKEDDDVEVGESMPQSETGDNVLPDQSDTAEARLNL
jgi:hypothetical protein